MSTPSFLIAQPTRLPCQRLHGIVTNQLDNSFASEVGLLVRDRHSLVSYYKPIKNVNECRKLGNNVKHTFSNFTRPMSGGIVRINTWLASG